MQHIAQNINTAEVAGETIGDLYGFDAQQLSAQMYNAVRNFFDKDFVNTALFWLEVIFIVIGVLAAYGIFKVVAKQRELKALRVARDLDIDLAEAGEVARPWQARWDEVTRHLDSNQEPEWRLAVMEADKLLDYVLQRAGYAGETLGERLSLIKTAQMPSVNLVWEAHKLRNRLAHELDFHIDNSSARTAVGYYQKGLEEFGAL